MKAKTLKEIAMPVLKAEEKYARLRQFVNNQGDTAHLKGEGYFIWKAIERKIYELFDEQGLIYSDRSISIINKKGRWLNEIPTVIIENLSCYDRDANVNYPLFYGTFEFSLWEKFLTPRELTLNFHLLLTELRTALEAKILTRF